MALFNSCFIAESYSGNTTRQGLTITKAEMPCLVSLIDGNRRGATFRLCTVIGLKIFMCQLKKTLGQGLDKVPPVTYCRYVTPASFGFSNEWRKSLVFSAVFSASSKASLAGGSYEPNCA